MKRRTMLAGAMSIALLLAGCGNTELAANNDSGHGANHAQGDTHGGHNAESAAPADHLKASFAFASGSAKANEKTEIKVRISDKDGSPVNDFEVNHEKLMHLIVVSEDLSSFSHIHPEFKGEGTFTVPTTFLNGGKYKMFADFKPAGGSGTTLSEWVHVEGEAAQPSAAIAPDAKLVKEVGDKEIELSLSGTKANEEVTLSYDIRDAKTKEGIQNLEPYLGAVGHVVILSQDAEQYLHVHPLDEKATGPKAEFATTFPHSGIYKIWGQFQHKGEVFTVPFVVEIK
ncbi:hypothetical protein JNE38_27710 [Brevibacillus choshinensis]|uniref:YtkA-like domain-containing protein n=2 Tax=Brevibacillus choshinensis TaxID=54911 RepID=A0ABX7FYC8_BRECH|nr:hypothetical protein JNE38_27710 [Brevibacillus choshinensis]